MSALALQCEFCGDVADLVLDEAANWRCAACLAVIGAGNRLSGNEKPPGGQKGTEAAETVSGSSSDAARSHGVSWAVGGRESGQSEARREELERRRRLVMATTRGLSRLERHRAVRRLLLDDLPLPPDVWDQEFAAWRRELEPAARAAISRLGQVDLRVGDAARIVVKGERGWE